jgi:MFS family permease
VSSLTTYGFTGDLMTAFALALGFNDRQIGTLTSTRRLAGFTQLFTNQLIERIGSKNHLYYYLFGTYYTVGIFVAILPTIAILLSIKNTVFWLIFLMFIISCAESIGLILKKTWMSELTPADMRGRYFGLRTLLLGFSGMLVGYLSSLYVDRCKGIGKGMFGFQSLFLASSLLGYLTLFIIAKVSDVSGEPIKQNLKALFMSFQKPFRDKPYAIWMAFYGCYSFGIGFAGPFFTVYLLKELGLPLATVAIYTAVGEISSIALSRFWGSLADKYGNKFVLIIACIGKAIFPALWIFTTNAKTFWAIGWLVFVHLVRGLNSAQNITTWNISLWLSPDDSKPVYLACESTVVNLLSAISPFMGGLILSAMADRNIEISIFGWIHSLCSIHILFLISAFLRGLSCLVLIWVKSDA